MSIEPFKDNASDENQDEPSNSSNDLKSVLIRSSDAFITWRYIHEGGKEGEYVKYDYEFYRLELICDIVRARLTGILQTK